MSCLTAGLTNHGLKLLKLRAKINLFGRPRRAGWDYGRARRATGDGLQRLGKVGPGAGEAVAPGEAATSLLLHRRNPGAATALPAPRACSPRCTPSGNRKPLVKGCGNGSRERNPAPRVSLRLPVTKVGLGILSQGSRWSRSQALQTCLGRRECCSLLGVAGLFWLEFGKWSNHVVRCFPLS
jgi:hypothetical protein